MVRNGRKVGISMVALVITIIVLIVLTSAVVITGVNAPKQAQLATFYNNVATVQELVSLTIWENMIEGAMSGNGENYKWTGIVEEPANAFTGRTNGISERITRIKSSLLDKTTIPETERTKYYVGKSGTVYYEGFEYNGQTYYNKDTVYAGLNNKINLVLVPTTVTATEVFANPTLYLGAYVNYTDEEGQAFKAEDQTTSLQWRVFHVDSTDGGHIYLTTSGRIGLRTLSDHYGSRDESVEALLTNNPAYVNNTYVQWAHDGIECTTLALSYNKVKGSNPTMQIDGDEETGFYTEGVSMDVNATSGNNRYISALSGLQTNLYNIGTAYWLASKSAEGEDYVMDVYGNGNQLNDNTYPSTRGIRPLVKLNSNVKLVESGVLDVNGYMTYNLSL